MRRDVRWKDDYSPVASHFATGATDERIRQELCPLIAGGASGIAEGVPHPPVGVDEAARRAECAELVAQDLDLRLEARGLPVNASPCRLFDDIGLDDAPLGAEEDLQNAKLLSRKLERLLRVAGGVRVEIELQPAPG